ncbi:MAG TPA: DUF177 domain-containing protein [Stellaceae bacterium]|nr:DUF177 domain-containing protein [Stellaceae bacterium]
MSRAVREFPRPVPLARIGVEPYRQEIEASEAERDALARRFDLLSLERLSASVELVRRGPDMVLLHAVFTAGFAQSCVISLEPVEGAIADEFTLLYGPPEREEEAGATVAEDIAFEPLLGETIDIGEAVAQEFSLALPQFPRLPDAEPEIAAEPDAAAGPFAALARLSSRPAD